MKRVNLRLGGPEKRILQPASVLGVDGELWTVQVQRE